jgi:hypothetical protein
LAAVAAMVVPQGAFAQATSAQTDAFMAAMAQVNCTVTGDQDGDKVKELTGMNDDQLGAIVQELMQTGAIVPVFDGLKLVTGPCK